MNVKVRCDDSAVIYIDGTEVGRTLHSGKIWSEQITANAKTIAIYCHNEFRVAGLIASFSNGLTTDKTWRCSHDSVDDWYKENFDDSDWDRAYVIQANNGRGETWPKDEEFPDNAKWIWGGNAMAEDASSYCRGKLSELTTFHLSLYTHHNAKFGLK